ncbi:integral membrane sensor signal transduction histidine kinase [Dehalogenimonas lykanthroporepellens BL-DC-9]|nr:integral membrane sensor signal transduction histidine kinase [Dehalogenimonas lykanthroporepellens BL-DC-9]
MTGASGELTTGRLYEMKRLEWLFIGARWLWVPALFLLAGMHEPSPNYAIIGIGLGLAIVNGAAMVINRNLATHEDYRKLGVASLTVDTFTAWALILLFVSDFYTAAYAGFLFVVIEGTIRYGLKGSLIMTGVFAVGLLGAYAFRDAVYDVRFSYSGYTFWTLLIFLIALPVGFIVDEGRRQRRRSESYLKDKTLLEERQRIARDMHDNVLKTLHGLALETKVLERKLGDGEPAISEAVSYIGDVCRRTSREVRDVILDLRHETVDEGIATLISGIAGQWGARTGTAVEFESAGDDRVLPAETAHQLRNIVSEALTNVERHAAASMVTVNLKLTGDSLSLEISDNGRGLDGVVNLDEFVAAGKLGLAGIRERVELLGGRFQVESSGNGTMLLVEIPLIGETSDEPD